MNFCFSGHVLLLLFVSPQKNSPRFCRASFRYRFWQLATLCGPAASSSIGASDHLWPRRCPDVLGTLEVALAFTRFWREIFGNFCWTVLEVGKSLEECKRCIYICIFYMYLYVYIYICLNKSIYIYIFCVHACIHKDLKVTRFGWWQSPIPVKKVEFGCLLT